MIDCPACIAFDRGEQPSDDGIYVGEYTEEFAKTYVKTWEELEAQGLIVEISPGFIDNTEVLRLTRAKLAAAECFLK